MFRVTLDRLLKMREILAHCGCSEPMFEKNNLIRAMWTFSLFRGRRRTLLDNSS